MMLFLETILGNNMYSIMHCNYAKCTNVKQHFEKKKPLHDVP